MKFEFNGKLLFKRPFWLGETAVYLVPENGQPQMLSAHLMQLVDEGLRVYLKRDGYDAGTISGPIRLIIEEVP